MSTKALKKELLVAVVMLLVAAVALSGSTYAWFAKTLTVEASKIDVVVETASTLAIAHDSAHAQFTDFGTIATLTAAAGTDQDYIKPVTFTTKDAHDSLSAVAATATTLPVQDTAVEFYRLSSSNTVSRVDNYAAARSMQAAINSSSVASDFVLDTPTAAVKNYLKDTVHLAYFADNTKNAAVSVAVAVTNTAGGALDTSESPISEALHVALVWTDKKNTNTIKYLNFDTEATSVAATTMVTLDGIDDPADATQIDIYVWYEGEDDDCYTMNALKPEEVRVALTFTAVEGVNP